MAVSANRRKITFLRNATAVTGFAAAKAAIEAIKGDIGDGEIVIATYTEGEAKKSLLAVKNLNDFTYITESSDEIAALVTRATELQATHAKGAGKALATVAEEITAAVNKLNVEGNVSAAVKGLTVQVDEEVGKVKQPIVKIADGTINGTASDANLVTGTVVKEYVGKEIEKVNTAAGGLGDRVDVLEKKHAEGKTVAEEVAAGITGIDEASKTAGTDVKVTVTTQAGSVTSVAVDSSILKKAVTDGDTATLSSAKTYADEQIAKSVTSVYKVKGTKATYADLPKTGNVEGDVWNVTAAHGNTPAGTNYVWVAAVKGGDDAHWDPLGGTIDLSPYAKIGVDGDGAGVDTIKGAKKYTDEAKSALLGTENAIGNTIFGAKKDVVDTKAAIDKYTVNGKKISENPVLAGADMLVGGEKDNASKKVSAAIEELYTKAGNVSGNIDDKIATAIGGLDATVNNATDATAAGTEASKQIKVEVKEVDGVLTEVTVAAPSFEISGAANAVKAELLGKAGTSENTIISAKEDAAAASKKVDTAIGNLDVANNVSEAVKGVTVTVNETDGKVTTPIVAIADGTIDGASDGNLVTGTVVKEYVDGLTGEGHVVTTFGGQSGPISVKAATEANTVKLAMNGKELTAVLNDIDCGTF